MGETTLIIKRRIRHWKTTAAGVATLLAPLALAFFPDYKEEIMNAVCAIAGAGLIAAADGKPKETTSVEK